MKYRVKFTNQFKKSYKRCMKRGLNPQDFMAVVQILAETGKLPAQYRPHKLSGRFQGAWECHIQPNWLLIWQQNDDELLLLLLDTGTHSDIF